MAETKKRVEINDEGGVSVTMPKKAIIRSNGETTTIGVPKGQGYDGYRYDVSASAVKELDEKTICVSLTEWEGDTINIYKGEEMEELAQQDIVDMFSKAPDDSFGTNWVRVEPQTSACTDYSTAVRVRMPDNSEYAGKAVYIAEKFRRADECDEKTQVFSVPDWFTFKVSRKDEEPVEISAETLKETLANGTYAAKGDGWTHIDVPVEARAFEDEKSSKFNMPKGDRDGCSFRLPNGCIKDGKEEGMLTLSIHPDMKINLIGPDKSGEEITPAQLKSYLDGKTKESYRKYTPKENTAPVKEEDPDDKIPF